METSSDNGLTVTIDDETNTISLEWDPETHPEYNPLEDLTSEEFCKIIFDYAHTLVNEKSTTTEIPAGGQSCGTTESNCDSRAEG